MSRIIHLMMIPHLRSGYLTTVEQLDDIHSSGTPSLDTKYATNHLGITMTKGRREYSENFLIPIAISLW